MVKNFTNIFNLIFFIIIISSINLTGQRISKANSTQNFATKQLDINQVTFSSSNKGDFRSLDFLYNNKNAATWKQLEPYSAIVYSYGLWLVGKRNADPILTISQWGGTYSPGPIINNQPAMLYNPADSLKYRVYKITKGDNNTNQDYNEWPVNYGAPVNQSGKPKIYSDQTLWTVFNAFDSTSEYMNIWNTHYDNSLKPLPIEIQQLSYSRKGNVLDNVDIFANTIFLEYKIINKGNVSIDSAYIGFWSDIDFVGMNTAYAIDTTSQLAYCYSNNKYIDTLIVPPTVGFKLLYGPEVPSQGTQAIKDGKVSNNFENLNISSFHPVHDDASLGPLNGSIYSVKAAWNAARGLDLDGNIIIDPVSGKQTKFPFSGDPNLGSGWLLPENVPPGGGGGILFFSGPFNFAANDTQWVMIALIPTQGNDRFESINIMKEKSAILSSLPYDSLAFGSTPYKVEYDFSNKNKKNIPEIFSLSQNYPNPFNPSTVINFNVPVAGFVTLKIYDILGREVRTLLNEEKTAGSYKINFDANELPSGVYLYRITSGNFAAVKKMILLR